MFGIFLAPLSYLIVWELVESVAAAFLAAFMVICGAFTTKRFNLFFLLLCQVAPCHLFTETGTLTLSQYILLDPPLMFFVMASTFCAVKFASFRDE